MRLIADLHIHSRFSRATSKRLGPAGLDRWARIKGISLLGTGDCTHPGWLAELRDQLEDAEEGFFALKEEFRSAYDAGPALAEGLPLPENRGPGTRFVLTGEISTLYRQGDRTRKVHHLVILPDFPAAAAFQTKLERVGNILSDGRPILGINSRDLMGLLLETDPRSILIPAHIWTPWFSVLGAKSGFDSLEECYGDLASLIPVVETGLSSNPPMNWALSSLDRYGIISNSDAHSPDKLGREATVLEMELSYPSLREALYSGDGEGPAPGIRGTVEFFPQEGKYHYDGHRACGVCLGPEEAAASAGICPVCGKGLTRGVMGRVLELADRPVDESAPCPADFRGTNRRPYHSLIPLREILGELLETGPGSKKIDAAYGSLIEKAGSEFAVLMDLEPGELEKLRAPGCSGELLAAAITRMRAGEVSVRPGYDGEYGVIRAFPPGAARRGREGAGLFDTPPEDRAPPASAGPAKREPAPLPLPGAKPPPLSPGAPGGEGGKSPAPDRAAPDRAVQDGTVLDRAALNREQAAAVSSPGKFALIIAGPGTGKTSTLVARITRLLAEGAAPSSILALSFTVKAAAELRDRIGRALPGGGGVFAATFHSLCAAILREETNSIELPDNFKILAEGERELALRKLIGAEAAGNRQVRWLGSYIEGRKQFLLLPGEKRPPFAGATADLAALAETLGIPPVDGRGEWLYKQYREELQSLAALDFDDLVAVSVRLLVLDREVLSRWRQRFRYILVDEYQDVNFAQYALIRLLAPPVPESAAAGEGASLWVIGDPNQAIYGFRGSDKRFIDRFTGDYAGAERFQLSKSFRCPAPLTGAAGRLVGASLEGSEAPVILRRAAFPTEKSEAEGIARRISALIGGSSFFAIDSGAAAGGELSGEPCAPGDCAILLRTTALAPPIVKALKDHGIPFELTGEEPWWEEEPVSTLLGILKDSPPPSNPSPAAAVKAIWEKPQTKKSRGASPLPAEPVMRLISLAGFFDTVPRFLDALAVSNPGGVPDIKREGVKIMSIHASKGLEFGHVFVAALEERLLPFTLYARETEKPGAEAEEEGAAARRRRNRSEVPLRLEEERRLLYVAMTRARKGLYLSWTASRHFNGRHLISGPSRFLAELETLIPLAPERPRPPRDPQIRLF